MKLSEHETNLAIISFKTRIYVGFVLAIFCTIAFIVLSIIMHLNGYDDLVGMLICFSVVTVIIGILLGIYIFKRRSE